MARIRERSTGNGRYGVMVANYGGPMRLFEAEEDGVTVVDRASDAQVAATTGGRALVSGPIISSRMDIFANNEGWSGGRRLEEGAGGANASALVGEGEADFDEHGLRAQLLDAFTSSFGRRLGHWGAVDRSNYMFVNQGDGTPLERLQPPRTR